MTEEKVKKASIKGAKKIVDEHVGKMIKAMRVIAGMTQTDLASALGITFQQLQKYEKATNKISANMLNKVSAILGCNIADFFPKSEKIKTFGDSGVKNNFTTSGTDKLTDPQAVKLMKIFFEIPEELRTTAIATMQAIANSSEEKNK